MQTITGVTQSQAVKRESPNTTGWCSHRKSLLTYALRIFNGDLHGGTKPQPQPGPTTLQGLGCTESILKRWANLERGPGELPHTTLFTEQRYSQP